MKKVDRPAFIMESSCDAIRPFYNRLTHQILRLSTIKFFKLQTQVNKMFFKIARRRRFKRFMDIKSRLMAFSLFLINFCENSF